MNYAPVASIVIRKARQRQEFEPEAMQELKNSIADLGLMHPPVMRQENGQLVLVAGERRIRAIQELWALGLGFSCEGKVVEPGMLPYTTMGELSELEAEEAELDENLKRKDLTWKEHAAALQKLHELRQKQKTQAAAIAATSAGPAVDLTPPVQTVADTAKEVLGRSDGAFQDAIRKELIVARNLANPLIEKAKNVDEAFKILKKAETDAKNRELGELVGKTFTADIHRLEQTDACSFLRGLPPGSVDVILTDPPYGMGADSFGDGGGKLSGIEHEYDDSPEAWRVLMAEWCPLSFQVAKAQAHAYVFCDFDRFHELKAFMQAAGWYVFRTPIIVHKINSGRVPLPECGPRRQYELVLYAIKGNKPVTHIYPDVLAAQADDNLGHGAQKPVAVYQNLLQRSVKPGDVVLDSFAGTGTIFPAAHSYQCQAWACENNAGSYGMAVKRLQGLKGVVPGTGQEALL